MKLAAYGEDWFLHKWVVRFGYWRLRRAGTKQTFYDGTTAYNLYLHDKNGMLLANKVSLPLFVFYWWAFFGVSSQRTIGMYLHMLELEVWHRRNKHKKQQNH